MAQTSALVEAMERAFPVVLARSPSVLVRGVGHAEPATRNSVNLALLARRARDIPLPIAMPND
ncbi:hypothetical protein PROAA_3640005 [Candidatus Propionivibrio aalborgensis]|uniref:Uncharacterized protein n=1 Tax=Candidatus Propionivibrio aalborgensis TaxID=1860101 RepID=A0A1A8XYJ2_9RHOO|nr:hypothetical protein PROAA_3640005 [Candidatus Propionivibrio aalborgensis]